MTSPIDPRDTDAKLSLQQRQQLSALVDGDLAPDQAAFLLRRLGHDAELAGRWQRWQPFPKERTVEHRLAKWISGQEPEGRVFASGGVRFNR